MKFISPLLSDARASVGGATFSKNRGGNYIRAKVAPVQPRSVAQQTVRANLSVLAGMWKSLSAADVAGWNTLAGTITLKDSLGNSYSPSGIDLFVGNNRNLSSIDEPVVEAPPAASPGFEDILPLGPSATAGTPTFVITTGLAAAPTGFKFLVRATTQSSTGVSYFTRSAYRVVASFAASAYASLNIESAYVAKFGPLVAGSKIAVAVSLVEIASGFQGVEATATLVVAA
jgi:hypothetical protein